jgi:hypothetical protein
LSVLIFFISTVIPYALLPFYFIILKITKIIGWINTRIILGLIFYFVFMPAGITLKIFKKDLLDLKKDSDSLTYWKKENKKINCNDFEKQY